MKEGVIMDAVIEEARAMNATGTGITGVTLCLMHKDLLMRLFNSNKIWYATSHPSLHIDTFEHSIAQKLADAGLDK